MPTLIKNRKAYHDYEISEKIEAGIKLTGYEVKALKDGLGNLTGSYIKPAENAMYLWGLHIPLYHKAGSIINYNPTRNRKLLLNKKEIESLSGKATQRGFTIIPLEVYSKGGLIKVLIGLGKGKKKSSKKSDLKRAQEERSAQRELKETLSQ